jgi:hypothetical protein
VGSDGVCPCWGAPVLQPVTSAGDRPQRTRLPLLRAEPRALPQCIRDQFAVCGSETVIVQLEQSEAPVVREEGDNGVDVASARGIVGEVEPVEGDVRFECVAESSERE